MDIKIFLRRIGTKEELNYIEVMQVLERFIVLIIDDVDDKMWDNINLEWR